jgi:glycine/D-amino acid oxidase-like deaminating enzyme
MAQVRYDVAVVGAGIVGAACAFSLSTAGMNVVLIDRGDRRAAASWGNAGHFAYEQVLPLATPGLWTQLPRLLLSRTSPVRIAPGALWTTMPWLARFLLNTRPAQVQRAVAALASLLGPSRDAWQRLAEAAHVLDLMRTGPILVVGRSRDAMDSRRPFMQAIRRHGMAVDELDAAAARAIEPTLRSTIAGAFAYPDAQHCVDPGALTQRLAVAVVAAGGTIAQDDIERIEPEPAGVAAIGAGERRYVARHCVVAAGIRSRSLLKGLRISVPLAAERGYHVMVPYREGQPVPRVPIIGARPEFVITPMSEGLRLAGTVELARPDAPPSWGRTAMLKELAEELIGPLEIPEDAPRWMGNRPTLPDSLPAIGSLRAERSIIAAFGHQHLGLTLAAITADMVRAIALGQPSPVALQPFALERF